MKGYAGSSCVWVCMPCSADIGDLCDSASRTQMMRALPVRVTGAAIRVREGEGVDRVKEVGVRRGWGERTGDRGQLERMTGGNE